MEGFSLSQKPVNGIVYNPWKIILLSLSVQGTGIAQWYSDGLWAG
jgi:hypothetical protein